MPIPLAAGVTTRLTATGTNFYLETATAPVNIRPSGGDFSLFKQGEGQQVEEGFYQIEVQNPNNFAVVINVWMGFDDFIDRRLILTGGTQQLAVNPLVTAPGTVATIAIPDLSGGQFTDIGGTIWLPISRAQIIVSNLDAAAVLLLQKLGNTTYNTGAVMSFPPAQVTAPAISGSFQLVGPSATLNALVCEVYNAIPGTST